MIEINIEFLEEILACPLLIARGLIDSIVLFLIDDVAVGSVLKTIVVFFFDTCVMVVLRRGHMN